VDRAVELLYKQRWVIESRRAGHDRLLVTATSLDDLQRRLIPALATLGEPIVSLTPVGADLERIFLELTS
jgi:hypothetical protein